MDTVAKKLFLIMSILTLAGCASLSDLIDTGDPLTQATVQLGALKFIDGDLERAGRTIRIIGHVQAAVDGNQATTIKEVQALADEHIPWSNLAPEEQIFLRTAIAYIAGYVAGEVEKRNLDPETIVRLQTVLDWISEAAETV